MSNERPYKRPREDDVARSLKSKVPRSLRPPTPPSIDMDTYMADCTGTDTFPLPMDHWTQGPLPMVPVGSIHHASVRSVASASVLASASISASNPGLETTPTMFPRVKNAVFNGSTFVHTAMASSMSEGFKILHQNIASGAFHDSGERFEPAKCHPNTRVAVLAEIMQWIKAIDDSEPVLWLYGSAGVGKSAIGQTIAEMCAELGLLVASFFFSRAFESRNNEKHLIASIAYQLALAIPPTRSYIESAVQNDPAIFDRSLDTQIKTLIIRPLENVYTTVNSADVKEWPRLIIIDGLDECHDPSIQRSIIRLLSDAVRRLIFPLRLLIASRPEPHIRNTFNVLNKSHAFHHIVLDNSYEPDADIKTFLLDRFNEIKENHPFSTDIPNCWPSEGVIDRLVRKSSGQFIYASTVMKYLESPKRRPMKQLDVIVGLRSVDGDMPYKELDALYSYIFSCVEDLVITQKILGFLFFGVKSLVLGVTCVGLPQTRGFMARLVGLDEEDVHLHLSELHSVLCIPPNPAHVIRPTHASLKDFLIDRQRSVKYYIDEEAFHTDVARQCVRQICMLVMNKGLEDVYRDWQRYLLWNFMHHCIRASTDSTDLKNELMQLSDLGPIFEMDLVAISDIPELLEWLYKADGAAQQLSSHIQSLWDRQLTLTLDKYAFNRNNMDIVKLFLLPPSWFLRWLPPILRTFQAPNVVCILSGSNEYQDFLSQFFEDKNRSGKYYVDGTAYGHAVLECFQNMINPNSDEIFNPYPFIVLGIERPDVKSFMSINEAVTSQREILIPDYREGLNAVITLLDKAAPLNDLYLYLRDHPLQNPAKAKVHCEHGFGSLRVAVKGYLDKCKHLVPRVLRRSASCPLYSSHVDFDPEFKQHEGTFNERWPLASDGQLPLYKYSVQQSLRVSRMRQPPEMSKLRYRIHDIRSREKGLDPHLSNWTL